METDYVLCELGIHMLYGRQNSEYLTFKRLIKSRLPFAGIIRSSPYSTVFLDKG